MPVDFDKVFNKGWKSFQKRKYEAAIGYFNDVIEGNPQFELAWRFKAKSLHALNKFEEANNNIDKALELNSSIADSWLTKMYTLLFLNKYEEALNCCNEALKIHPNKYWLEMAYIHEHFKHYEEALKSIDNALSYDPQNSKAQRIKSVLENGLKYGKNYYIPIAGSPLLNIIPPEDDIIYSTLLEIKWQLKFKYQDTGGRESSDILLLDPVYDLTSLLFPFFLFSSKKDKGMINTPALITHKGIAVVIPPVLGQDSDDIGFQYIPWNKVSFSSGEDIIIRNVFNCKLIPELLFESEEAFEKRKATFQEDINNLRYEYTKYCLEIAESYAKVDQDEIALQYIERGMESNVYIPKFELMNELMAIKNPILEKQRINARKIEKGLENLIIDYLGMNLGKAFTIKSLTNRLIKLIDNPDAHDYFKSNLEGLLNRLAFKKVIKTLENKGITYYFLETKETLEKEVIDDSRSLIEQYKKFKIPKVSKKTIYPIKSKAISSTIKENLKFSGEQVKQKPSEHIAVSYLKKSPITLPTKQVLKEDISKLTEKKDNESIPEVKVPPKSIIRKCSFCGFEINEEQTFCQQCGMIIRKK